MSQDSRIVVGIYGYIGSGKDTVANRLVQKHGFTKLAFADALKDVVAAVFGWDRAMLNGDTPENRLWRETSDPTRGLSPREAMQRIGTDLFRNHWSQDTWINAMRYRIQNTQGNIVITDCRFQNEIDLITELGGQVVRVLRTIPEWETVAKRAVQMDLDAQLVLKSAGIHPSEWSQVGFQHSTLVLNFGTLEDLYAIIDTAFQKL